MYLLGKQSSVRSIKRFSIQLMKNILAALLAIGIAGSAGAASTINTTNQYAWGANIGWTNWRPDFDSTNTEGVIVGEFICSGYVYAANAVGLTKRFYRLAFP
jgi:hypothetical protein